MSVCGFEPAKVLVRGLTATPTTAFRVRLGNYHLHWGSGGVLSQKQRAAVATNDPKWDGVWVGEGGWGERNFLSRPKSAALPRTNWAREPFRVLMRTSSFPCGSPCVPINPHGAKLSPYTRHSTSDTEWALGLFTLWGIYGSLEPLWPDWAELLEFLCFYLNSLFLWAWFAPLL